VNASLVARGAPSGVTRVAVWESEAASVIVTVFVRLVVPGGIVAARSTEKTTEPVVPAFSAPTLKV
jgi:hypothetical protein